MKGTDKASPHRNVTPSPLLRLFDKATGVLVEVFDPRLLLAATTALMAYTVYFTQHKFPGRWMEFVALGMVLVGLVAIVARTPEMRTRIHWHLPTAVLWFALHSWMLLSGLFYEDWLSESMALLIAYPFLFAIISARDDTSTLYAVTRGAVYAALPFLLWSYLTTPIVWGYPGYRGVFYNANGLAMCSDMLSVCALLLAYADWQRGRKRQTAVHLAISLLGAVTVGLTLSRSAWVTYLGVLLVLLGCIFMRRTRYPMRVVAGLCALTMVAGSALVYVSYVKARQTAIEDYEMAVRVDNATGLGIYEIPPDERVLNLNDFSSDRIGIWREALTNLTWNGHPTSVIEEWVRKDGGLRRLNAHNSFVAVAYNHGWPAALLFIAYVALSAWRAWCYYWLRRAHQPMAIAPLLLTTLFVLESLFESVYAPFSVVGCAYLLVQGVLWRENLSLPTEEEGAGT